jgi:N-acetylglucosamine-6-phosphate deacetylase
MINSGNALKEQTITGVHYRTGEPLTVRIQNGYISQLIPYPEASNSLPFIGPGLTDLQVNGFQGIDVNSDTLTVDDLYRLTRALWAYGVTAYFPTVITNTDSRMIKALETIRDACQRYPLVKACLGGIHLEGPFISPQDGPVGAHPKAYVKAPDWPLFKQLQAASGNQIKLITLSPEWPDSADFISRCVATGVVVSIGHTAATPEQIRQAVEAGARMSTHLGNGSHQLLPRHPNYIWEQLAQDDLTACLIADGFHLPDAVLKVVMKVKEKKAILVSDSVGLAGCPPGQYTTHIGGNVVLTAEGKLHVAGSTTVLAGSAQPLLWGIQHLLTRNLGTLGQVWDMGSIGPSRSLGLPQQQGLAVGAPADLVTFDQTAEVLQILETYKQGVLVYHHSETTFANSVL